MTGTISPIGVGSVTPYDRQATAASALYDVNAEPGPTNTPIIYEPPAPLTSAQTIVWVVATGASADWGGCYVYLSNDGDTYRPIGTITRGARQGALAASLPSGPDPDLADTLHVDMTESGTQLLSGSRTDADTFVTLCYCDGELVAYQTATLVGANLYDLTYLRRGVYETPISTHSAGRPFARVGPTEPAVLAYRYPQSFIGTTVYLKFTSFNLFIGSAEELSDVPAYPYVLTGAGLRGGSGYVPPTPIPLFAGARQAIRLAATEDERDPTSYRVNRRWFNP